MKPTRPIRSLACTLGLSLFIAVPASLAAGCGSNSAGKTKPRKATDTDKIERDGDKKDKKGKKGKDEKPLAAVPNEAVGKVGDVDITNAAFHAIYDLKQQKYEERGKDMPVAADRRYRRSIVERLIYHELLRQEAERIGVDYDAEKLAERKERQRKGIKDWDAHLRRRGESETSLEAIAIKELRELAILEGSGALKVSEEDLQGEYEKFKANFDKNEERIRVSHILVRIGPDPRDPNKPKGKPTDEQKAEYEAKAMARAKELHAKATAAGADFAALAREESDGPSARKGGDLNIVTADRMPKEFSDVAFALQPGQISEPVKSKFGVHIIRSVAKYPAGLLPLDAVREQLEERLELSKLREGRTELRERLLGREDVVNKMDEWLGPDPRPKRKGHGGHSHGDAKKPGVRPDPAAGGATSGALQVEATGKIGEPAKPPKGKDPEGKPAQGKAADAAAAEPAK
jgi:peptidyl-prolyl cis-trans isomerase C